MPGRISQFLSVSFLESISLIFFNTIYIIISTTTLPWITFLFTMLLVLSRLKMFLQKYHKGSIKIWFLWFVKKN